MARRFAACMLVFLGGAMLVASSGCSLTDKVMATTVEDSRRMLNVLGDTMTEQHAAMMPQKKSELEAVRQEMTAKLDEIHSSMAEVFGGLDGKLTDARNSVLALVGIGGVGGVGVGVGRRQGAKKVA